MSITETRWRNAHTKSLSPILWCYFFSISFFQFFFLLFLFGPSWKTKVNNTSPSEPMSRKTRVLDEQPEERGWTKKRNQRMKKKKKTWTSCDGESLFQVNNHRIGKQSKRVYIYNKVRRANSCSARPGQQRRSKTFRRPLQCFALNAGAAFSDNILLPPCLFNPVISFQRRSSSSNLTFLLHHRIPAKIKKIERGS
jgi:hypothetical protein